MKLRKIYNSKILNLFILIILIIILYSNCFRFPTEPDDLIIKFNVENAKFKNNEYVAKVKNKVKKEMKIIKNKLSYMKIPDDLDIDSPVKIYEMQNTTSSSSNVNDNNYEEDDNDFEEKDMIRKPKFSKLKTHLKNNSNFNSSDINQFKALVYNKNTKNITFNYSIINEDNIERKKILKFFISALLECNVMVNETISYKSPEKIKSILHYLITDRETRISPVGVYSSLGQVDYFAFQRSTKTFKVNFLEELTKEGKSSTGADALNERGFFRSFGENEGKDSSEDYAGEMQDEEEENRLLGQRKGVYRKATYFPFENVNFLESKHTQLENPLLPQQRENPPKISYKLETQDAIRSNSNNPSVIGSNKLKKNVNTISEKSIETAKNLSTNTNTNLNSDTNTKALSTANEVQSKKTVSASSSKSTNSTADESPGPESYLDFSLEYIYDAKQLIHSVSDFRSTPDFNNISYNYDRLVWNLANENSDKSEETVKIELFFDMEESFYSENIFLNLNFTKSIYLLNQTEKRVLENSYTKIDSNIMLEVANYAYADGAVYLMEKKMNSSPDLDRIQYYVKNKKNKNKNDLIKIMKVEAEKVLRPNETFQLEVKFPLYFENCRNYKTNTMIMITGIVLMVFLGSLLYLVVSLNFSDKE